MWGNTLKDVNLGSVIFFIQSIFILHFEKNIMKH